MPAVRVDCEACKSRFRLEPSLFKGARAIRVRCRHCGRPIIVVNPESPPGHETRPAPAPATAEAGDYTFESMTELWQARRREAGNGSSETVDIRVTDDFVNKYEVSNSSFAALKNIGESYLKLVKGVATGNTCKEDAVMSALCFFPHLLKAHNVEELAPAWAKITGTIIDETFFLGLASHLIISDHPHRYKVHRMAKEGLYLDFLDACGSADQDLREYNKDMNGIPGNIFKEHFARQVEPLFAKAFSIGFWKMGKVRSRFRSIFFAGIALGVLSDGYAEEYLVNA